MTEREILAALEKPFYDDEIEWRAQTFTNNGKVLMLPYIDARAVAKRLDEVVGAKWSDEYKHITINNIQGFTCTIKIKFDDEWIGRSDGAEATDFEGFKGAHSSAFKRAASKWGIGRALYDLPQVWLPLQQQGKVYVRDKKTGKQGYVTPPTINPRPNTNQQLNQQSQNQQEMQQGNSNMQSQQQMQQGKPPINQSRGVVDPYYTIINPMLEELQLPLKYIEGIFKRLGFNTTYDTAREPELKVFYEIIAPVHSFYTTCLGFGLNKEQMLYYAKIVVKEDVKQLAALFFKMNKDTSLEAIQLVKADFDSKQIA